MLWKRRNGGGLVSAAEDRDVKATPWLALLALAGCSGAAAHNAHGPLPNPEPPLEPARVVAEFRGKGPTHPTYRG